MPTRHADRLMPTLRRVVLGRQTAARTDGELLTAFVATADGAAFAELVRRHGPMVLGVCRRVVPDHGTADDAFQAVFLVLARRAAAVRPRERVGNWLYGVAYRTALKARTVLARRRSREKQVDAMPEPTAPPAAPAWADVQPVIDEELARLPEKLRVAVVLCDLEGRTQREVARHLGVPPATLATRLASARRTLAARLTRRGVTLSGGALAGLLGTHASASAVPHALSAHLHQAAAAVASGGPAGALVSAQAVQLSEGVVHMMMLAKLKAVAVLAAVALALATGLGVGLAPAAAGDCPDAVVVIAPAPTAPAAVHNGVATRTKEKLDERPEADDALFLRRLSLDVRGTMPTPVETWFFVSDSDDQKRAKVIEWIVDDEDQRAAIAKKLGVPVDRVRVVRVTLSAGHSPPTDSNITARAISTLAFSPDGRHLAANVYGKEAGDAATATFVQTTRERDTLTGAVQLGDRAAANKQGALLRRIVHANELKEGETLEHHLREAIVVWSPLQDGSKVPKYQSVTFDMYAAPAADPDAEFLKQVLTDVRGSGPTALELKYFTEDKDTKKREKLLDTLLKEPAVQKKLGDEWRKQMLAVGTARLTRDAELFYFLLPDGKDKTTLRPHLKVLPTESSSKPFVVPFPSDATKPPAPPVPPAPSVAKVVVPIQPQADKLEKLVAELIAARKSDEALLEAVTLATLSRLPTDAEKKLALAVVGSAADRKVAWVAVARALAGTGATKGDVLQLKVVPPAKP